MDIHILWVMGWPWRPLTLLVVLGVAVLYALGWSQMRRAQPGLATPARLGSFAAGLGAVTLAMLSPLYPLQTELLAARVAQQILLGIIAPPLLWLGCPFHLIVWGLPAAVRRQVTRGVVRPGTRRQWVRLLTRPALIWLGTVSVFLIWHDPQTVGWLMHSAWIYGVALWIFFLTYLLFWWHLLGTGPRLHRALPAGMAFVYVILGGEVPNMVTGITLAFQSSPIYAGYASQWPMIALSPIQDQMISGGMIWLTGSFAYISTAIVLLSRLFRAGDHPPRLPLHWDATERTIAPGLEHRVLPKSMRKS